MFRSHDSDNVVAAWSIHNFFSPASGSLRPSPTPLAMRLQLSWFLLIYFSSLLMSYLCCCTREFSGPTGLANHQNACQPFKRSQAAAHEKRKQLLRLKINKRDGKVERALSLVSVCSLL
jgi:hypothetical protein